MHRDGTAASGAMYLGRKLKQEVECKINSWLRDSL